MSLLLFSSLLSFHQLLFNFQSTLIYFYHLLYFLHNIFFQLTASIGNSDTSVNLTISITDVNDFQPRFLQPWIHIKPNESELVGILGFLPPITDSDSSSSNLRISHNNNNFNIIFDRETGLLSTGVYLDREQTASFHFDVEVTDAIPMYNGDPRHWDRCRVLVDVIDVDDNVPVFKQSQYFFELNVFVLYII